MPPQIVTEFSFIVYKKEHLEIRGNKRSVLSGWQLEETFTFKHVPPYSSGSMKWDFSFIWNNVLQILSFPELNSLHTY